MNVFQCPYCKESYFTEPNMEAHIQAKHSGVEVECQECGFKCKDYNFLKLHRTMFHMGPPPPTNGAAPAGVVVPPPQTSGASPIPGTNPLLYLSAGLATNSIFFCFLFVKTH